MLVTASMVQDYVIAAKSSRGSWESSGDPLRRESARILRISGGYPHIVAVLCGFSGAPP